MQLKGKKATAAIVIGVILLLIILIGGTYWMSNAARKDTDDAVRSVTLMLLEELAGRRERVVEDNLQEYIETIYNAVDLMTDEDLSDEAHRVAYHNRMRTLYHLERFGLVGKSGIVYTYKGPQYNIGEYSFNYRNMTEPDISIRKLNSGEKRVVIAVPIENKTFQGDPLTVCFMEISMEQALKGASMDSTSEGVTFCNLYTQKGDPLTDIVLGGLAKETNLLDALKIAEFTPVTTTTTTASSYEEFVSDFNEGNAGVVSFTYNGVPEILSYVPVEGTDWMLTYLIRENSIIDRISSITNNTIMRSLIQSLLTVLALVVMFGFIIRQNRRNAKIVAAHEAAVAANKAKQEEMEHRLALQNALLEEKAQGEQQGKLITALSSDYRSVYYLELDRNHGVCYQSRSDMDGFKTGEEFPYLESVTAYCNKYVLEPYREEFLNFIQPDNVREGLKNDLVISYRYMIDVDGKQSYEAVKFAGVRHPEDREDHLVHTVGACFADVDAETRAAMQQNETLSEALSAAEQANRAKTAFLSNMSHEIRTPMNAIIGLDNIALNDPETPEKTKDYLTKIGSSAEHLLNLINDILDMSRIESGRLTLKTEEFSFPKLLEAINTMFSGQAGDKGIDYQCHILSDIDDYYIGDNMKLRQVLINILGNAMKFTPVGGKVDLTVQRTAQFDGKSTMRFEIADTGIGMSEDFLPHLFDAFAQEDSSATNKYGSSGLGMAITKRIVEMMNGHIEVESKKGEGSKFTVTVTLVDSERRDVAEAVEAVRPSDMTVLVVDDDPVACEHAKLVLEKTGIASEIAASGAEAIEMVRLRHARREPYNLILVDWQMPEMDGVETTRRIRDITGHESAIIILTAYRWDDVLEEALQAGVDSFIPKPLFAANVLEEFKSALKRKNIASPEKVKKADLKGRNILLAEDVPINAEIMMMVLQGKEMTADLAENGRIAVEKFAASDPGFYDAVLMDMRMPEMDGLEATRTIRAMDRPDAKSVPIIALTANAFDEDVQRSLQAGLNAHLSKPVQPENLYETLESLIRDEE